jgi:hemolysin III
MQPIMDKIRKTGRPTLRGWFHQIGFFLALGACSMLIAQAHYRVTLIAALVYSVSLVAQFFISALYHRINWSVSHYLIMKRIDHSAIFFLIAGTATPIALLALPAVKSVIFLKLIWGIALGGVVLSVSWVKAPKPLSALIYFLMGWVLLPFFQDIQLSSQSITLLFTGGIFYSIGALIYALRKPNLFPGVFCYHELFHVFTLIAATCHFIMIAALIK